MAPARAAGRVGGAGAAAALLTAGFVLWLQQGWGGPVGLLWMENLVLTGVPLAAGAACWMAARRSPPSLARAWRPIAAGCALWGLGSAVVTFVFNVQQAGAPVAERTIQVPGLADVGFLAFFPLVIVGLLRLPQGRFIRKSRVRTALDGLITVAAVLFVAWAAGVGENTKSLGAGALRPDLCAALGGTLCPAVGWVFGALNPLGDVLLASVALFVAGFAPRVDRAVTGLLCGGFVAIAVADVDFSTRWLRQDASLGNLLDAGWVAGFSLIALAAIASASPRLRGRDTPRPTPLRGLVPYLPLAAAIVAAGAVQVRGGALPPFLFWNALAIVVLVLARQWMEVQAQLQLRREVEAAYARLRDSESFRTRLLHNVTHDLVGPLTPIHIQLKLLAEAAGDPEAVGRRTAVIARNVEQVRRLIGDLSDVAKLEDGRLKLLFRGEDVGAILCDVHESFQALAEARGLRLALDPPPALAAVCDAGRIRQVVVNLVTNALKFTPSGGAVRVAGAVEAGHVVVSVTDTGRGLTAGEIARLFKPFSQVHDPGEAAEKGTGLGLYISRGLAEAHGGALDAASAGRGHGSAFTLRLPCPGTPGSPAPTRPPPPAGP